MDSETAKIHIYDNCSADLCFWGRMIVSLDSVELLRLLSRLSLWLMNAFIVCGPWHPDVVLIQGVGLPNQRKLIFLGRSFQFQSCATLQLMNFSQVDYIYISRKLCRREIIQNIWPSFSLRKEQKNSWFIIIIFNTRPFFMVNSRWEKIRNFLNF